MHLRQMRTFSNKIYIWVGHNKFDYEHSKMIEKYFINAFIKYQESDI